MGADREDGTKDGTAAETTAVITAVTTPTMGAVITPLVRIVCGTDTSSFATIRPVTFMTLIDNGALAAIVPKRARVDCGQRVCLLLAAKRAGASSP